jgi:hypothetical protein
MSWVRKHSFGLFLFVAFVLSLLGQWLTHDESPTKFWNAVFENWQSEFLQLLMPIAVAAAILTRIGYKGFEKDTEQRLDRIEVVLRELAERGRK